MKKPHSTESGFTIIELSMAIAIVGILAVLAIPRIGPMQEKIRLRNAAHVIERQLAMAKSRAVSDPYTHCGVYFDLISSPQKTFIFYDNPAGTANVYNSGTDAITMGVNILPPRITLALPASGAIVNNVIIFRGNGSAKNGGTVVLKNRYDEKRNINVLPSTGRIKVLLP